MTEERKEELKQLLQEALANSEIRCEWAQGISYLSIDEYRNRLRQRWDYSGPSLLNFTPHIVREVTKLKLLDFIREELSEYIHQDLIQSACFFIAPGGQIPGYHLSYLLYQLLRIAIARGVEGAVLAFDRCTTNTHGSFQYLAILEGIKLESEIQVYECIRLVPLPENKSHLPRYLLNHMFSGEEDKFTGKTLLIIDATVSPMFCKPSGILNRNLVAQSFHECMSRFKVEVNNSQFANFDVDNFYGKFCQALSLVCNSAVKISRQWRFLAEDKLFNLASMGVSGSQFPSHPPFGMPNPLSSPQIDEVKCLYSILVNLDAGILKKMRIPIDRWLESKTSGNPDDKVIDLAIALESFYLLDRDGNSELSFQFRLRAAWFLGKDKAHRKELMKDFRQIYDWRSKVVHTGKLPNKTKRTPFTPEEVEAFITNAQNLCRDSILKILEDGKFPDWNDLILGEE